MSGTHGTSGTGGEADEGALLAPQPPGIPLPEPAARSKPFWDGCDTGRLVLPRCPSCGTWALRAFAVCARCHGTTCGWEPVAGTGTLHTWTVVWRPPHPAFRVPYAPAVAALDEGAWLLSAVVGCRPGDLCPGMAVRVAFHPASEHRRLPYLVPALPAG